MLLCIRCAIAIWPVVIQTKKQYHYDQTLGLVPPDNDDGDDVNDGPGTVPPSMLAAACWIPACQRPQPASPSSSSSSSSSSPSSSSSVKSSSSTSSLASKQVSKKQWMLHCHAWACWLRSSSGDDHDNDDDAAADNDDEGGEDYLCTLEDGNWCL